eukprot:2793227-Rhodomonas_salina.6
MHHEQRQALGAACAASLGTNRHAIVISYARDTHPEIEYKKPHSCVLVKPPLCDIRSPILSARIGVPGQPAVGTTVERRVPGRLWRYGSGTGSPYWH